MRAVVLSGGGSKGAYEIGVWKALRKLHIHYDIVTGTSVGALNGALMTQKSYYKALYIWHKLNMKLLFGNEAIENTNTKEVIKMYKDNFLKNGGMDTKELANLIDKSLNKKKFYNSKINYGLVTMNLSTFKPVQLTKKEIKEEQLTDYLIASASCYPAFQTKKIDGEKYIDGGFFDNMPVNLALKMGATEIIAVNLSAPGVNRHPKKKVPTITIRPNNKLTNFLKFYQDGTNLNIQYGYNDTMKVFKKLEGKKYTFKLGHIKKNKEKYQEVYFYLLKQIFPSKKLLNRFLEVANFISNDKDKLEEKILLKIMEDVGKNFQIDDTKIYSYKKFNKLLRRNLKQHKKIHMNKEKISKTNNDLLNIYQLLEEKNYSALQKLAFISPIKLLKALYLYTICEA